MKGIEKMEDLLSLALVPSVKQQSNTGVSKTSNTHCDLCDNPYPYMCSECMHTLFDEEDIKQDAMMFEQKKINISSGEDVILHE